MQHYIIHYSEIALKNKNRSFFEGKLQKKISDKCNSIAPCKIHRLQGRLWLEFNVDADTKKVKDELQQIFGVANFIPAYRVDPSLEKLKADLQQTLTTQSFSSFAVRAKRSEKSFPLSSQFINEEIGRFVKEQTSAKVDLGN